MCIANELRMSRLAQTDAYGFRLRGGENTCIESFIDAAFGFAVTLLTIGDGQRLAALIASS